MDNIYEASDAYANQIIESEDFQRLLFLKNEIQKNCSQKIIAFKTAEAKYSEAKQYGSYHPDLNKYQVMFVEAKQKLYSDPLVKEYIELEGKIQEKINRDINDLKKSISNKFKLNF